MPPSSPAVSFVNVVYKRHHDLYCLVCEERVVRFPHFCVEH